MQGNTDKKIYYFNIYDGKFRRRANDSDSPNKIMSREGKEVGTVYKEVAIPSLQGYIDSLSIKTTEKGDIYMITMSDDNEKYVVHLNSRSKEADRFCASLPNINFDKQIYLQPHKFTGERDGKLIIGLTIKQDGVKIYPYYTQKTPNGFPMPTSADTVDEQGKIGETEFKNLLEQRRLFFRAQFVNYAEQLV